MLDVSKCIFPAVAWTQELFTNNTAAQWIDNTLPDVPSFIEEAIPTAVGIFAGIKGAEAAVVALKDKDYKKGGIEGAKALGLLVAGILLSSSEQVVALTLTAALGAGAATAYAKLRTVPAQSAATQPLVVILPQSFVTSVTTPAEQPAAGESIPEVKPKQD
jgi:uncharacterized membrane protein HdeD (DUF308 family)